MNKKTHLINNIKDKPELSILGVIIKKNNPDQYHTGFTFKKENYLIFAHFGWNETFFFQKRTSSEAYYMFWFDLEKMPERTSLHIINELQLINDNNEKIKDSVDVLSVPGALYGILNSGKSKFSDGKFIGDSDLEGDSLTCSVFVNCIFEQCDYPIIDFNTWKINTEDQNWQEQILSKLEGTIHKNILEIQRQYIGKVARLRPEQLVGACSIFNYKLVDYDTANVVAKEIIEQIG